MQPPSSPKGSSRHAVAAAIAALVLAAALGAVAPARSAQSPTSYIHGRLIDGKGKPVAVAQVLLMSIATSTVFSGAASGSDGTFSFYGMKPGPYGIIAQKTPACAISHAIAIKPGKTYDVLIRMPSSSRCYGPTHFKP
jgi:protocatechuate 3,4-dioxygenase beta subunit